VFERAWNAIWVTEGSGACLRPRCLAFCANANYSRLHLHAVDPAKSLLTRWLGASSGFITPFGNGAEEGDCMQILVCPFCCLMAMQWSIGGCHILTCCLQRLYAVNVSHYPHPNHIQNIWNRTRIASWCTGSRSGSISLQSVKMRSYV
jgi:hypothetical protein